MSENALIRLTMMTVHNTEVEKLKDDEVVSISPKVLLDASFANCCYMRMKKDANSSC